MPTRRASFRFEFTAPLLFDPDIERGYMKHFVPVPPKVAEAFEEAGIVRLVGSLGAREFRRVLHTRSDGSRCLKFGEAWLAEAGLVEGAELKVTLQADPNPDQVDVPDELAAALERDLEAALAWRSLTPGKQRTMAYGVERAKQSSTRARRAAAVIEELLGLSEPRTSNARRDKRTRTATKETPKARSQRSKSR